MTYRLDTNIVVFMARGLKVRVNPNAQQWITGHADRRPRLGFGSHPGHEQHDGVIASIGTEV